MFKLKFALAFLIVLAVYIHQTQGKSILDKKDEKDSLTVAKSVAAKIKLAAVKKLALLKAIASAPFVLGKKAAVLKIGAVKSLAQLKAAKAKKVLGLASKKVAPVVDKVSAKVDIIKKVPAALAAIPGAVASIPVAAGAAAAAAATAAAAAITPVIKPSVAVPAIKPQTDVAKPPVLYTIAEEHAPILVDNYSVNLHPAQEVSSSYEYYSVPNAHVEHHVDHHGSYYNVDLPAAHHGVHVESHATDTEVVVPHDKYGVPKSD